MTYFMENAIRIRFASVLWCQKKLVSEMGELTPLYQGRPSKFCGREKLTSSIEQSV